jgi:hypothetical protein
MRSHERTIAEAAIKAAPKRLLSQVRTQIAEMTGQTVTQIEAVIADLEKDSFLKKCSDPARNYIEQPDTPTQYARIWYEKGKPWE